MNTTQLITIKKADVNRPNNSGGVFSDISPLAELTSAMVQPRKIKIIGIISLIYLHYSQIPLT
jgi:hypothetical protein